MVEGNISGNGAEIPMVKRLTKALEDAFYITGCHYTERHGYIQISSSSGRTIGVTLTADTSGTLTVTRASDINPRNPDDRKPLEDSFTVRTLEEMEQSLPSIMESIRRGLSPANPGNRLKRSPRQKENGL